MQNITDRSMQASPSSTDRWLTQPFKRGAGTFVGRITPAGERLFYFRYTDSQGRRPFLPLGSYHPKGTGGGLTLADAFLKATELSKLYQSGVRDLREHFAQEAERIRAEAETARLRAIEAEAQAKLEAERKVSVRALFEAWAKAELTPHQLADGERIGRKDGGEYTRQQFERRIFGPLGDREARTVTRADLLGILGTVKEEGKLRTANVLFADLKQMFRFAEELEIVDRNPLEGVRKRKVGGRDAERNRRLSAVEIKQLARQLPSAQLTRSAELAVWLILSTACRVGELMSAEWVDVDL